MEWLARWVCEGRAGLLTHVQGLLIALLRLAELRLAELALWLETSGLGLHGRVLLLNLRHHAILLLHAISGGLRLELLKLLLSLLSGLQFLQALTLRSHLGWLIPCLHGLLEASELRLERWRAESGLLGLQAWC